MAIDYGTKRVGVAVTDPLKLIPGSLDTVATGEIFDFLRRYMSLEEVELIVVGEPLYPDGQPAQIHHLVLTFVGQLKKLFPTLEVVMHDERYTSEEAKSAIRQSGAGKKKRRDKALVDRVSAVLILRDYLETRGDWAV